MAVIAKDARQQVCVLGATGSIGLNTLDVIARHPDLYQVYALSAHRDGEKLFELCLAHAPRFAVLVNPDAAAVLRSRLVAAGSRVEVLSGAGALEQVASDSAVDIVMAAIVGAAGLPSALAAARGGKKVLLANKEALVMAGKLFMSAVKTHGATLLPIDSEHNAIFQCLPDAYRCGDHPGVAVRRILLTASGGPFRLHSQEQLQDVTAEAACRHPNWSMGQKISIDSATLMNKGLELIEACWLFNTTPDQVEVVVHPESIIHSMVEYVDGSTLAQLGNPDMRTSIAYGLAWPQRIPSGSGFLDLVRQKQLNFEAPDATRFPCLDLARRAFALGGTAGAVLNAANEVAVAEFLAGTLPFMAIPAIIARVLELEPPTAADSLALVLAADQRAREQARALLIEYSRDFLRASLPETGL